MIAVCADFYPLVLMSFGGEGSSRTEIAAMFARIQELAQAAMQRGTYHATISISHGMLSPTDRKYVAELTDRVPSAELERTVGAFVVIEGSMLRGALTALRWLSEKLMMVEPVASIDDALIAARARLAERGAIVSDEAVRGARAWLLDVQRGPRSSR